MPAAWLDPSHAISMTLRVLEFSSKYIYVIQQQSAGVQECWPKSSMIDFEAGAGGEMRRFLEGKNSSGGERGGRGRRG